LFVLVLLSAPGHIFFPLRRVRGREFGCPATIQARGPTPCFLTLLKSSYPSLSAFDTVKKIVIPSRHPPDSFRTVTGPQPLFEPSLSVMVSRFFTTLPGRCPLSQKVKRRGECHLLNNLAVQRVGCWSSSSSSTGY